MAQSYKLGMDAKIYHTTAAADTTAAAALTPATMTELANVKDVSLSHETGEADITTRANSGWRATAATLRECSAEFEMVWKPGDAGFEAIKNAWLAGGEIALAIITGDQTDDEGPIGNFSITNFSRNEALEEAITVSVTAKLSLWGSWHTVA